VVLNGSGPFSSSLNSSTNTIEFERGLMNKSSTSLVYAQKLESGDALVKYNQGICLWSAAEKDAKIAGGGQSSAEDRMTNTLQLVETFYTSEKLHDRDQIVSAIENILLSKGKLGMLLGGNNTGKSLMLCDMQRRLNKENQVLVLYVDMREHGVVC
jgi:hypothetical protein